MNDVAFDAVIAGTGAVGLSATLALARQGLSVCLIGPPPGPSDGRTAALLEGSLRLLADLGLARQIEQQSGALRRLRIVDDTGSLFRPPPVEFDAAEIGLDAFGRNIENATLVGLLAEAVRREPGAVWRTEWATDLEGLERGTVRLSDGSSVSGKIVAAADGRRSRLRSAAGIEARDRALPQSAVTAVLEHEGDHRDVSTEFHRRGGPFTLVPLPGRRSSLVWVDHHPQAERRLALPDDALCREIERASHGILGQVTIAGPRGSVPLGILTVDRLAAGRLALLGEAGHALPPIGAQGLNLGLADVRELSCAVRSARNQGDFGPAALAHYARAREAEIRVRTWGVLGLNAALLSRSPPLDAARGLGLGLLARVGPLRRAVMRAGLMDRGASRPASRPGRLGPANRAKGTR